MTRRGGPRIQNAFVVLSDLHFGNDLYESPTTPLLNVSLPNFGISEERVTRFFEDRCRGHFAPCVKRLPRYLRQLLWQLREDGFPGDKLDLLILLGDQSTLASASSYRFLREYVSQTEYETRDGDGVFGCSGLGFRSPDVLAIPGNHDKLLRKNLSLYNDEFTRKLDLAEQVEPQRCTIAVRRFGAREFIFILIDPSTYCVEDLTIEKDCRSHLAAGNVGKNLVEDVRTKLMFLKDYGQLDADVKLATGFSSAMKVLLVHYAVDETRFRSGLDELLLPHGCAGLGELVELLRKDFQLSMVLHGHLHVPLLYNYNGVQVISASTATRVDENRKTGFFLIKVFDTGAVIAEHHLWTGIAYTPDPDKALTREVGYFPEARVPAA
jgi:3',5'-cyclic AMP phosphodiesterase CpdA